MMYHIAPAEVPFRCYTSEVHYMEVVHKLGCEGGQATLPIYKNWKTQNLDC